MNYRATRSSAQFTWSLSACACMIGIGCASNIDRVAPAKPSTEAKPKSERSVTTFKDSKGKAVEIVIDSSVPASEVGFASYPKVKKFEGSREFSKRETPFNVVYASDFETEDTPKAVLDHYAGLITVKRRLSNNGTMSIAGKDNRGAAVSVTAVRAQGSSVTSVHVRIFRKK